MPWQPGTTCAGRRGAGLVLFEDMGRRHACCGSHRNVMHVLTGRRMFRTGMHFSVAHGGATSTQRKAVTQ
eukprot:1160142-Pelagomonas_calceolata.AAC.14